MQPKKQLNRIDLIVIITVILVILGGVFYFAVIRNQQNTAQVQEEQRKYTADEVDEQIHGKKVQIPIEYTRPREIDPETGEYKEIESLSGEMVEIRVAPSADEPKR